MACPSEWNVFYFLGGYTGGMQGGIDAGDWFLSGNGAKSVLQAGQSLAGP
jgi:hypothetical protein